MKKIITSLILSIIVSFSGAQTLLDIETIKEIATTKDDYYKGIVELFNNNDPYLDTNDIAVIYYGQAFRTEYTPTGNRDEVALKKFVDEKDHQSAYNTAKKIIKTNPVSLNAIFNLLVSAKELGKSKEECKSYALKYMQIVNMIAQYGDGKTRATAFKVITPDDQDYILYGVLNIEKVISNELDSETLHNIFVVEPTKEFQSRRVYFDLSLFLNSATE